MYETLDTLREHLLSCRDCGLCETRKNVVFGAGNPKAKVMVIGEGPGKNEDEQGKPFVGRAGVLLDKLMAAVDLSREKNVFITNMVKCRPPENRDPKPDEIGACIELLRTQVKLINPKIIVCVGRVAAVSLISPDFKVTKQHGQFFEKNGYLMMGTIHPAAILRAASLKPAAFDDWIALRDKLREICPEVYEEAITQ